MTSDEQNWFRTRREELGMTQRAVAVALDMTVATVSNWERGEGLPRINMIERLSAVYQVAPDELVKQVMALAKRRTVLT